MNISLVVPTFNEAGHFPAFAQSLRTARSSAANEGMAIEIIWVNDGCTDETFRHFVVEPQERLVSLPTNRGYGRAIQSGVAVAAGDWIALIDADGTYRPEDLLTLCRIARTGVAEMVVGARVGIGIKKDPFRRLARWVLRSFVWVLCRQRLPDLNSGLRVLRRERFSEFAFLLPEGFSLTTTLTTSFAYRRYSLGFTPITYERRSGKSHIRPVRDFFRFVRILLKVHRAFAEPQRVAHA